MYPKKTLTTLVLTVAMLSPLAAEAQPGAEVIDQRQPVIDDTVGGLAIGGASDQRLAQTVTAGVDGRLVGILLPVACDSGRLVVEIRDLVGGEPGPTVLARREFRAETLPPRLPPVFVSLELTGPLDFLAGDRFAVVLDNPTGSCGSFRGPVGDSYAAGEAFFEALPNPPGWLPFTTTDVRLDLAFMTEMRVD